MAALLQVAMRSYQIYESTKSRRVPWDLLGRISDISGRDLRWLLHGDDEDSEPNMAVTQRLDEIVALLKRIEVDEELHEIHEAVSRIEELVAPAEPDGEPPSEADEEQDDEGRQVA